MRHVFIDTSYLIAILDPKDDRHERAEDASKALGSYQAVTSEMILTELLNYFCSKGKEFRLMALNATDYLRSAPEVEIVSQTHEQFEQALQHYRQRPDKAYSLTDCGFNADHAETRHPGLSNARSPLPARRILCIVER